MVGTKDADNVAYSRKGGVISKDEHENFLAPEKEWKWILCRQSSKTHTITVPSQNRYIFFKGQKRLIKDKRDLEYFSNSHQFLEISDDEEVIVTETPRKPTNANPIPSPEVKVEVKKIKRGRPKKDIEVIE